MNDPIAWDVAEKVATRVGGRDPFASSYHYRSLQPDFEELTAEAEELVAAATGLRSLSGPARARVTDRADWVRANIASFRRLMRPMTERLGARMGDSAFAPIGRVLTGVQVGSLLGWMSTRVLGQYDLLVIEDERPDEQDLVYYVGPNIIALEKRFAFPPREFRLWLALHEVTHRAQFTGVPWMRPYFLSLVESSVSAIDPDPRRLLDALRRAVDIVRDGRNPLSDGVLALLASTEQQQTLNQISGLMSLLEGHGDITMDRAGADRIPEAERFSRVLRQRRNQQRGPAKLLQQVIGLEAKLRQYEEGERFIEVVEAEPALVGVAGPAGAGGPGLLARVWEAPEFVPTVAEIRTPALWIARVRSLTVSGSPPSVD